MKSLLLSFSILFLSLETQADSEYHLSPSSYARPIKSCYRWVGKNEMKIWKNGHPFFNQTLDYAQVKRSTAPTVFCWSNSVGSAQYGEYLIRIDLVDDAVMFDRNKNTYTRIDAEGDIPTNQKKGIYSEIVYSYYINDSMKNSSSHQHEYYISSENAIKSWSLGDRELKSVFSYEFNKAIKGPIEGKEYVN